MGAAAAPRRAPAPPSRRTSGGRPKAPRSARRTAAKPRNSSPAVRARRPKIVRADVRSARARIAPNGFAQPALAGAALIPHAAVGAVGAVRDLSDSSLIMRLTRGRGWIAVLCALLVGIVTLNVISLSLNAGSGRLGQQIAEFEQANSGLRAELAEKLSSARIEQLAPAEGYYVPDPESVAYLSAADADLEKLLRLFSNDMVLSRAAPAISTTPSVETFYPETGAPTTVTTETTDTTATAPTQSEPVTSTSPAPTPTAPAPTATPAPSSSGGGIGAGL
jgi:hypothetical protein